MKLTPPVPIIKDGIVVNADELKKFYQERYERNCRIRRGMFNDLRLSQEATQAITSPVDPPPVYDTIDRLRGDLTHIRNIFNEHVDFARKKAKEYRDKKQPFKEPF